MLVILSRAVHISSRRRTRWDVDGRYPCEWAFARARKTRQALPSFPVSSSYKHDKSVWRRSFTRAIAEICWALCWYDPRQHCTLLRHLTAREGLQKAEKFGVFRLPPPPLSLSFLRQVKRLLPISPTDRRKVGEFVFRQPAVIQPETSLLDCLNLFQTKKTHLAFVTQHSAELESYIGKCTAAIHSSPTAASSGTSVVYSRSSQPTSCNNRSRCCPHRKVGCNCSG